MGEQPIFTCKAHVFHIDPKTKRSWIPASSSAINVSFFYDSTRSLYRIISVEGTKAVINSTITPNMTFTKTSQKFGQWSDVRANTVYGLGFPSEAELNKFIEKFQEVKEATKNISGTSPPASKATNGSAPATNNSTSASANASPVSGRSVTTSATAATSAPSAFNTDEKDSSTTAIKSEYSAEGNISPTGSSSVSPALLKSALVTHQRSQSLSGLQPPASDSPKHQQQQKIDKNSPGYNNNSNSGSGVGSSATLPSQGSAAAAAAAAAAQHLPLGSVEAQLKYENDRLKLALAQSSANAKKWEVELATLKNNNARLTNALQESTANVEEWKRQLQAYKDENQRVKSRIVELEAGRATPSTDASAGTNGSTELKRELATMRLKVESLETELRQKDDEIRRLASGMRDMVASTDKIKALEEENARLVASGASSTNELDAIVTTNDIQRRTLESLNARLLDKVHELTQIQREMRTALET